MASPISRPTLRAAILRHLQEAGSDSISGVARALSNLDGAPVHRLTIAGHLAAMTEEGVLREVDRPPSKHYQIRDGQRHLTVHERIGRIIGELNLPAPDRPAAAVAVLGTLFGRPVFLAELQRCGFASPGRGVEHVEATEDQRRILRHLFRDDGTHPLAVPRADPLLQVLTGAVSGAVVQEALRRLAVDATDSDALLAPAGGPQGGVQARLRLEADGDA